ncbi:uncharacterized protein PHACADRAFT_256920 [Phanerochaete carnosa HHB-10118-sp]|uniref:Uncharacterized protein n=1 Tax=Phanerochaete carnosa (strain HHB-10118-sp) TaxID=650164 RepID=K5V0G2_PHACS|nr:uncharacterized protein PHACADRAFT_256920 [Phanerochaete carnosa HHB-10118-sp]EKM55951.1 hypothetical protein PHACADRAFT_256920 [Phanerochaete carnosa HHB-10118-sp]
MATTGGSAGKEMTETAVERDDDRLQGDAGKNAARFKRLQGAREMFLDRLKSATAEDITSDTLDSLYVLAMMWKSHEDLLWPSKSQ